MRWSVGTTLWLVPIRYWEEAENPEEVKLVEEIKEYDRQLYVFHSGYGHEVYVPAERCFFSREKAIEAGRLLTQLKDLKNEDGAEWLVDEVLLKEKGNRPYQFSEGNVTRSRKGHDETGYILHPTHHVHAESGNVSYLLAGSRPTIVYRGTYEAEQALEKSDRQCQLSIVQVQVAPIFPLG